MRLLLPASLLLNIFLAGAAGGGLLMVSHQEVVRPAVRLVRPIRVAGDGLPAPDRHLFRETMRITVRDNRDLLRDAASAREMAADLFVQPQFDHGAVTAALARARAADTLFQEKLDDAAVMFAAGLPAGERITLAQGLQRGGPLRHPLRPEDGVR